jgi:hypothetical protein
MYLKIMAPDSKHIFTVYGAISRHQREATLIFYNFQIVVIYVIEDVDFVAGNKERNHTTLWKDKVYQHKR